MPGEPPYNINDLIRRARQRQIRLPEFSQPVYVEEIEAFEDLLSISIRTRDGKTEQTIVSVAQLAESLEQVERQDTSPAVINALDFFLLIEAARIRLAYSFDPFFAVSMSGVQALPHQLQAVYERMLPQARLRFLLADDPGAGKTIMAGLLLKELKLRGVINYVLILTPAPLTVQWQDELYSKFDEVFEVINSDMVGNQLAGNVWDRYRQCIASLDFAKREKIAQTLEQIPWDLVIIDEAHKCSARSQGEKVAKTHRYQLVERLSARSERVLLLTATPHSGDASQFAHFLRLLDADQFPDPRFHGLEIDQQIMSDARIGGRDQWFLRRVKEELRDQDGNPLFTKRHANSVPFELTWAEKKLYERVTHYINTFLPYQQGGQQRRNSAALARTVLQRRLASSLNAIHRSLERREKRFKDILQELDIHPKNEHEKILQRYRLLADSDYEDSERDSGDLDEQQEEVIETFPIALRVDQLREEVRVLESLVHEAKGVMSSGEESKLKALRVCMEEAQFKELKDGRGKLLIFTEHRDTLEYLRNNLQQLGYITCEIHGGMKAVDRREAAQRFRESAQVCIATEAAGEGINLQFCHLMINYDIPWNPNRLEQRMGRIHRIGQRSDVYIFNFVATNTIEGTILERLFSKLEEIRDKLGDRVFDVVGQLLMLNEIRLEDMLREAAVNPGRIEHYTGQIEQLSTAQLMQLEEATGVALATSKVDLSWVRGADTLSQERRLMPEYVEKFFLRAAERENIPVRRRIDGLCSIERVPARIRDPQLSTTRRFGRPEQEYRKVTFDKTMQQKIEHQDAVLLSPGHPLFVALTEVLLNDLSTVQGKPALFVDPRTQENYRIHFFEIQIVSEEPTSDTRQSQREATTQVLHATLAAVMESADRWYEQAPADLLHDLTPLPEEEQVLPGYMPGAPAPSDVVRLERWVRMKVQFPLKQQQSQERKRLLQIRREYLEHMFQEQIKHLQSRYFELYQRVHKGDDTARLALSEADRRQKELRARSKEKLAELDRLQVVREGMVRYMGSAMVVPITQTSLAARLEREETITPHELVRNDEIERIGMEYVMDYEKTRGWQPEDISKSHDGSGFDIRSTNPQTSEIRRIEVKARANEGEFVELTPNEWLQAHRHGASYWLYVVWNCAHEPHLLTIQNPASVLANVVQEQVVIEGYRVSGEAIQRLQTKS